MRIDTKVRSNPLRRRLRRLGAWERREEASAFIKLHSWENGLSDALREQRTREVVRDLSRFGFYEHTPEELAFGARVAWRNHARCIARLYWKSLEVYDCRATVDPEGIAARMFNHMREAKGDGRVRSMITIFAPVRGDALPAYIESRQIVQYAGYTRDDGAEDTRVLGDPITAETTRSCIALGWKPPMVRSMFDVLPLMVRDARDRRILFEVPRDALQEVQVEHPTRAGLASMGLRWYSVPCVSSMILTIGGIDYPCAPFNGHYMSTEIASRDFCDERRYDLLEPAADALGISRVEPLWKDRVLTELNAAVLHSYRRDGVAILDHHEASAHYMDFLQREAASGRTASADWSWIVPPQAASACPVFHLAMRDRLMVPNYYNSRGSDGGGLAPRYDDFTRNRWLARWDRIRRRWYQWRRRRD